MVALREMDEDDLKSLGIDHTISRKRIMEAATPKVCFYNLLSGCRLCIDNC